MRRIIVVLQRMLRATGSSCTRVWDWTRFAWRDSARIGANTADAFVFFWRSAPRLTTNSSFTNFSRVPESPLRAKICRATHRVAVVDPLIVTRHAASDRWQREGPMRSRGKVSVQASTSLGQRTVGLRARILLLPFVLLVSLAGAIGCETTPTNTCGYGKFECSDGSGCCNNGTVCGTGYNGCGLDQCCKPNTCNSGQFECSDGSGCCNNGTICGTGSNGCGADKCCNPGSSSGQCTAGPSGGNCNAGYLLCNSAACCPSTSPYYCNNGCYSTQSAAVSACGSSCVRCGG